MNWRKIIVYAVCLVVAQAAIGFIEGSFVPEIGAAASALASFAVCASIFARLVASPQPRPFMHAGLVLVAYGAISLAIGFSGFVDRIPPLSMAMEWLVLVVAMAAGLAAGSASRRNALRSV